MHNLTFKGFKINTLQGLPDVWNDFTDVILSTMDDKQVRAHKIFLTSGSTFFENMFGRYPQQNPLIYLKDIHSKHRMLGHLMV